MNDDSPSERTALFAERMPSRELDSFSKLVVQAVSIECGFAALSQTLKSQK
jgi:hypothetical protein